LKRNLKFAGLALLLALYIPTAFAQESKVFRDGGKWTQEITGNLGASRNLRVKVHVGSVRVEGGSQS
jgi:branched-subunit amino acid transport protein